MRPIAAPTIRTVIGSDVIFFDNLSRNEAEKLAQNLKPQNLDPQPK